MALLLFRVLGSRRFGMLVSCLGFKALVFKVQGFRLERHRFGDGLVLRGDEDGVIGSRLPGVYTL